MQQKMIRLASPLKVDSIVDGPGLRCVVWCQGCLHECDGCHNEHTHAVMGGTSYPVGDVVKEVLDAKMQSGITLSGGEPFLQADALCELLEGIETAKLNVWIYSGYTFEEILGNPKMMKLLKKVDVLVDGKYEKNNKDYTLKFRGSKNQRTIDVQASLEEGKVVLWEEKPEENQLS